MSTAPIRIVLFGNPRAKARARSRIITPRGGKAFISTYTPAETREEESALRTAGGNAMGMRAPLTGALELRLCAYRAVPASWSALKRARALAGFIRPTSKPDFDNAAKIIDGLKGVCWVDDAQITDAHVFKRYSDRPRLVVEVIPIDMGAT